jgi:uncharacterized membrane protein YdjX (TVP38/TMEM64 family)
MEDTVITAQTKKRELSIFAACLVLAFLINAYAIASYGTSWSEMYSMIGMVVAIAVFFYAVQGAIRLLFHTFKRGIRRFTS